MNRQTIIQWIVVAAVFAAGVFLGGLDGCAAGGEHVPARVEHVQRIDTTWVVRSYPVETIRRIPGEIRYRDTGRIVYERTPCDSFMASTTFRFRTGDSMHVTYTSCANEWDAQFFPAPDSVPTITIHDSTTYYVEVESKERFSVGPFIGWTNGIDDVNKALFSPERFRVGIGVTYRLWGW